MGKAPAFEIVVKLPDLPKSTTVVNETCFRGPGELIDLSVKDRRSFPEISFRERDLPENFSRFQRNLAQCGLPGNARTLVKISAVILQTLRESMWVVGICVHHDRGRHGDLMGRLPVDVRALHEGIRSEPNAQRETNGQLRKR